MIALPLLAPTPGAAGAAPVSGPMAALINMAPLILMFAVFYFLLIRPQQQKQKALAQKVSSMEKGDDVITSGGMMGTVWAVKEDRVVVQVNDVRLDFVKSAIVDVVKKGS
jgi:preprotein translocase subunit YajC